MSMTKGEYEALAKAKVDLLTEFFAAEPPQQQGEDLLRLWEAIYDDDVKSAVVQTPSGPSDDAKNPVLPYEKLHAIVRDGGTWKWARVWRRFNELQRRGPGYREGDPLNFGMPNPSPHAIARSIVVVGAGPVGLRMAIELKLGGHRVTIFEKRREVRDGEKQLQSLGFTNRINRPHVSYFLRNDLDRLNGRDFMSTKMCYPIFTQGDTASIGIDELQLLLMKNALLLGVDLRLGVAFDDAETVVDPKTQTPRWQVQCTYDEMAAARYKVDPGRRTEVYDVLIGCDGARSRVRESQPNIFGEVDKHSFKKMIGVVANVQKVSRPRLQELGFGGREPTDMKRAHQGSSGQAGLNYYKASFHNYVIFTPSKDDLLQAGINSNGIYSFLQGRDKVPQAQVEEKTKLRAWVRSRCEEVGIPVDDTLSNGGFVEAPNDVMAFDFSEIWKCKKNFAFCFPPADYDVEKQGPWAGDPLVPPIGLVGDAVTEPFWLAGVGLKRGWAAIMDACYLIDNLYNWSFSGEPEPLLSTTWEDHLQRLQRMVQTLYDCSQEVQMTREGITGEYSDQGVVMVQLNKHRSPEKPQWQLEVDPFTRYEPLAKLAQHKYMGAKADENMHPTVKRTLGLRAVDDAAESLRPRKVLSVAGRAPPPAPPPIKRQSTRVQPSAGAQEGTVERQNSATNGTESHSRKSIEKNVNNILAQQLGGRVRPWGSSSKSRTNLGESMAVGPSDAAESGLGPAQQAELAHVRNMKVSLRQQITALSGSLESYERAERDLLAGRQPWKET